MSGFLMLLAVLSALGGVVLAMESLPFFPAVFNSLAAGIVAFAVFGWMAKVLDGQKMILAALAELRKPVPLPRQVSPAPVFGIGDAVHHAAFGDGEVSSLGDDGRLLVRFTDGLQTVPAVELKRRKAVAGGDVTKTCPKCYALLSADATRCIRCGFDYEASKQMSTSA